MRNIIFSSEEKEILKQVIDLFQDPNKWTFGAFARDNLENSVMITSKTACCWCLEGALIFFGAEYSLLEKLDLVLAELSNNKFITLHRFNDTCDYSAVIDFLNQIIEER